MLAPVVLGSNRSRGASLFALLVRPSFPRSTPGYPPARGVRGSRRHTQRRTVQTPFSLHLVGLWPHFLTAAREDLASVPAHSVRRSEHLVSIESFRRPDLLSLIYPFSPMLEGASHFCYVWAMAPGMYAEPSRHALRGAGLEIVGRCAPLPRERLWAELGLFGSYREVRPRAKWRGDASQRFGLSCGVGASVRFRSTRHGLRLEGPHPLNRLEACGCGVRP